MMLVRMLKKGNGILETVTPRGRDVLNLPEERALQLIAEGLCVLVSPESADLSQGLASTAVRRRASSVRSS